MSTKHTPEPWIAVGERVAGDGIIIASCGHGNAANAARIVDCVNAFEGIDDPQGYIDTTRKLREKLERLIAKHGL